MPELSDTKIRNAKPADKECTLADGQGLSVRVRRCDASRPAADTIQSAEFRLTDFANFTAGPDPV
jgi:hypothetical protein